MDQKTPCEGRGRAKGRGRGRGRGKGKGRGKSDGSEQPSGGSRPGKAGKSPKGKAKATKPQKKSDPWNGEWAAWGTEDAWTQYGWDDEWNAEEWAWDSTAYWDSACSYNTLKVGDDSHVTQPKKSRKTQAAAEAPEETNGKTPNSKRKACNKTIASEKENHEEENHEEENQEGRIRKTKKQKVSKKRPDTHAPEAAPATPRAKAKAAAKKRSRKASPEPSPKPSPKAAPAARRASPKAAPKASASAPSKAARRQRAAEPEVEEPEQSRVLATTWKGRVEEVLRFMHNFSHLSEKDVLSTVRSFLAPFFSCRLNVYWKRPAVGLHYLEEKTDFGYFSCPNLECPAAFKMVALLKGAEMLATCLCLDTRDI